MACSKNFNQSQTWSIGIKSISSQHFHSFTHSNYTISFSKHDKFNLWDTVSPGTWLNAPQFCSLTCRRTEMWHLTDQLGHGFVLLVRDLCLPILVLTQPAGTQKFDMSNFSKHFSSWSSPSRTDSLMQACACRLRDMWQMRFLQTLFIAVISLDFPSITDSPFLQAHAFWLRDRCDFSKHYSPRSSRLLEMTNMRYATVISRAFLSITDPPLLQARAF